MRPEAIGLILSVLSVILSTIALTLAIVTMMSGA